MSSTAANEIRILGVNGRCGSAVATQLAARQHAFVLVGRADPERLALPDGSTRVTAAQVRLPPPAQKLDSWTHARVQWPDGRVREGWLRAVEAMACTNAVTTGVTLRLANNEGRPGACTPGALFGPVLAVEGGQFVVGR
jgi:hypothetical protein